MSALPQLRPTQEAPTTIDARQSEAQKMEAIGRLVSGVAHDFNNLLTGIVLCSDLILAGLGEKSRLRRFAYEIRNAGARGADMVQQLLRVAQQRSLETQEFSLNQVISEMEHLLTRLIGENIALVSDLAEDLAPVEMASTQAQQVVMNLVLNARDAMPRGGRIVLKTRDGDGATGEAAAPWVELEVCDNGSGMDAPTRARVFEPFFTTKKPGQGSGLGLATVQSIVQGCGGTIEIDSESGDGTRVLVRLPAKRAEAAELRDENADGVPAAPRFPPEEGRK
jgi:two-component system, cell cycle sensor histidine kinase and response regulator CckA